MVLEDLDLMDQGLPPMRCKRAERETVQPAAIAPSEPVEDEFLGLTIRGLDKGVREQLGLSGDAKGVVVMQVDEASQAYEKGLRSGDIIAEAGQQKVETPSELTKRIGDAREAGRKSILLLVRRGGEPRFVALSLNE